MKVRPQIGVTGPDSGGLAAWFFTALAIIWQGGWPIRIRPARPVSIDRLDGLVIGGGADIDPERYQSVAYAAITPQDRNTGIFRRLLARLVYPAIFILRLILSSKKAKRVDPRRDELEFSLLEQAVARGLPVMGICRGAQLINVFFGGTLHQDISEFYTEKPLPRSIFPTKTVRIAQDSHLASALDAETVCVNALHRQAIKDLGRRLRVTAHEFNALIQAVEHRVSSFVIGVQWHPEYLQLQPEQRRLFKYFVSHSREASCAST